MDWNIPRYWDAGGELRDSDIDGPPNSEDIELGDSFLVEFTDRDGIDHHYWVHGGADLTDYDNYEDYIDEVIDALGDRYGFET